jgi:hypothetical protein
MGETFHPFLSSYFEPEGVLKMDKNKVILALIWLCDIQLGNLASKNDIYKWGCKVPTDPTNSS